MLGLTQIYSFDDVADKDLKICQTKESSQRMIPSGTSKSAGEKRIVLIGAGLITPDMLFNNGLYQNILLLYDLFESLGYTCILLSHKEVPPANVLGPLISRYRMIDVQEITMQPPPRVHLYLEIALSLDDKARQFFKSRGARIVKLYLGNALNIDTETCAILKGFYIPHHNVGSIDEIWTSPHYLQNLSYLCGINNVPFSAGRCVPYVWDQRFIEGAVKWQPHPKGWQHMDIVITEPNISFQKSCFYPLLLADAFARRCADWKGRLVLVNADKLRGNAYFQTTVLPELVLEKQGRIVKMGRAPICETLASYPSSLFLMHNWNNDYNYMLLELLDRGFPVLHNSVGWATYGYSWSIDRWDEAQKQIFHILTTHDTNFATYDCDAKMLAWKHAPQNPTNRALWAKILDTETKTA